MKRFCLVPLIGLPAVGKTTVCQYLMKIEVLPFNILYFCYDNLIKFNSEAPAQYKNQRENILKSLNAIIKELKSSNNISICLLPMKSHFKNFLSNDTIILCDDNHYYRSMRYKLFQLSRKHCIGYCQLYFNCTIQLSLNRNSQRTGSTKVPNDVINQMYNRLEVPNTEANKWEENTLFLQSCITYESNCNEIISFVKNVLDKPLHSLELSVSKSITTQSNVHELDIMLRKRIQILMKSTQAENKKVFAKNLNDKRKVILKNFQININEKSQSHGNLNEYVEMLT